jgi:predicted transposase/invertase (TIGR01784 family)
MKSLIRFDWAIKHILRNKANFDILEGFLSAVMREDVQVVRLLESESNQETDRDKFNRVDLLVETGAGELVLVEVQVGADYDFFHRIAYGGAKLLTEYIEKGEPYRTIRKVIAVCIAYFTLGKGTDYVYYGSTKFVGLHTGDELGLNAAQEKMFGYNEIQKIFPEYYVIRVNTFRDEVREALDEWVYMLKHSEVKPEFAARNIQKASRTLQVLQLDTEARQAYDRYMEDISYHASLVQGWEEKGHMDGYKEGREEGIHEGMQRGREEGMQKGREEGTYQSKVFMVKKALQQGLPIETIAAITELSPNEIETIQQSL